MAGPQCRGHAVPRAPGIPAGGGGGAAPAAGRHEPHRPISRPPIAMTPGADPVPRQRTAPAERRDRGAAAASRARRGWLWRQVPAYSPLTLHATWRAAAQTLLRREDARPRRAPLLPALCPARAAGVRRVA